MPAYLLTWNPKHFATGGDGSESGTLNYELGEKVRWSCNSQQPKVGDRVYIIRLGVEPRGIVASGTVSTEYYSDTHWSDESKQTGYIQFQMEDSRQNCEQGMLPMLLLKSAFPKQKWSPQSSGIAITNADIDDLETLWHSSKEQHCLELTLRWLYSHSSWSKTWYQNYLKATERAKDIKTRGVVDDADLELFWYMRDNGVASLKQGGISKKELDDNKDFLKSLTISILQDPTPENHTKVYSKWVNEGSFQRQNRALINRSFCMADPENHTSGAVTNVTNVLTTTLRKQFQINFENTGNWSQDNQNLIQVVKPFLSSDWDSLKRNIALWRLFEAADSGAEVQDIEYTSNGSLPDGEQLETVCRLGSMPAGSNIILYGPPGTGKTYHTVEASVKAADPAYADIDDREQLKARYDELVSEKRIRLVTFHQSFSYEEFVEGLRAETVDGKISYEIKPGIFRQICDAAALGVAEKDDPLEVALQDLMQRLEDEEVITLQTKRGNAFDLGYCGGNTFQAYPQNSIHAEQRKAFAVSLRYVRELYRGSVQGKFSCESYVKAVLAYLVEHYRLSECAPVQPQEHQNYVLIIDEINRGNISKIFGELITLIEVSKRSGQAEALTVQLPYSGEEFSVPANLHIIGTMNTADRSLAMMDTALRRRFEFKEMMPKCQLLSDIEVKGINIGRLLTIMNQRIEYLYDREHTLGHAFFMPLKDIDGEEQRFYELGNIFRNKVIPLLQEYFFEEWEKIRLVLADNQVSQDSLQFVKQIDQTAQGLFGNSYQEDDFSGENKAYQLNAIAFDTAEAYRKILGGSGLSDD